MYVCTYVLLFVTKLYAHHKFYRYTVLQASTHNLEERFQPFISMEPMVVRLSGSVIAETVHYTREQFHNTGKFVMLCYERIMLM